jgi:hypothetical protein
MVSSNSSYAQSRRDSPSTISSHGHFNLRMGHLNLGVGTISYILTGQPIPGIQQDGMP